jgi:colicin import membrane protein
MWKAVRENPRAVTYAVLMHVVLLLLLVFSLDWTPKSVKPGTNKPIQAELVDMSKLRKIEAQKKLEQQRIEAEKRKQEQDKQRKVEAERKQKAEQEKKRKAEAQRKQKAEQEKQRKAEAAARQREAEQALQAQLAEEESLARATSALSEYIPYIQEKVQNSWRRPAGSPRGLRCVIRVKLIPGGEVVGAKVVKSSGDALFDRSVESAVLKASPLPLPADPALFKHFREINFNFSPD